MAGDRTALAPERMQLRVLAPEPCCQTRCRYSADSIRLVLKLLRSGEDIDSLLNPHGGYDADRLAGFGPSFGPTWTLYVADLRRAQQAGCRTPEQVARFLCPFSDLGQDDDLLEAA
jgi:hypothetical protein